MIRFYVTIDYKSGPSYGTEVVARNKSAAKKLAEEEARRSGWVDEVKKVTAREA